MDEKERKELAAWRKARERELERDMRERAAQRGRKLRLRRHKGQPGLALAAVLKEAEEEARANAQSAVEIAEV